MRIYVPATLTGLERARVSGRLEGLAAHAVTPSVREWYTDGDTEELEFSALTEAAQASIGLLWDDTDAPRRRLAVAADVPDEAVTPAPPPVGDAPSFRSAVRLTVEVALADVVSLHVDEEEADVVVSAAATAWPLAMAGDEDARFTVDDTEGYDLLWYDITELDHLIG
jgi:hypothetical protein